MTARTRRGPMWPCPRCGRRFANRNQSHSCVVHTVEQFLAGASPAAVRLFERLRESLEEIGPVSMAPARTRVGFQVRMTFAAVNRLGDDHLDGHFVLTRRIDSPRLHGVGQVGPRAFVHHFRLWSAAELDGEFVEWLRESYAMGRQDHLAAK